MPPIGHSRLRNTTMVTGLIGQFMYSTNPKLAILIFGVALVAALLDGWWYLQPIGKNRWYPALFVLLGLTMWDEPRGWFFIAWAAIEIGTGLRAQSLISRWMRAEAQARAEERERTERLSALGVLYSRYLLLSYLIYEKRNLPVNPAAVVKLAIENPMALLGVWMVIFVAAGALAGYHFARDPWLEQNR